MGSATCSPDPNTCTIQPGRVLHPKLLNREGADTCLVQPLAPHDGPSWPQGPLAQDKAEGVSCPAPYRQAFGSPDGDQPSHKAQHHGQPRRRNQVTRGTHSHTSRQHCVVDMSLQRNSLWVNEVRHRTASSPKFLSQLVGPTVRSSLLQ